MLGFLKFLFYFLLSLMLLGWLVRLLAPFLLRRLAKRLQRRMEKEFVRQQNAYQQQYDPNYAAEVHVSRNMDVKIPREKPRKSIQADQVEAVDYEEIE